MRIVVADTGPIRYLSKIGHLDILPRLFQTKFVPSVVYGELGHRTPEVVPNAMAQKPEWLQVKIIDPTDDPSLGALDEGERLSIALGLSLSAELLLIDDRKGAIAARAKGLEVAGTLGILDVAARRGMVDLTDSVERLRRTNFRRREKVFEALLKEHRRPGA